jgi:tetratricopeptide (TPR) repeat protein
MDMTEGQTVLPPPRKFPLLRRLGNFALHMVLMFLIIAVTGAVFVSTLSCTFVYDDITTVATNRLIDHLSWSGVAKLFDGFHLNDYYPVFYLSLALDRALWALKPLGYHLTNVLLHALNALLVYALAHRIVLSTRTPGGEPVGPNRWLVSLVTALLFVVHPNHVEPVAWISGRKVLLATLFGLLSVHSYLSGLSGSSRRPWLVAVSGLCTAMACMSNVYAIVVPAFIILCDRYLAGLRWWKAVWRNWPFGLLSLCAVVLKVASRMGGVAKPSQFESRFQWFTATVATYGLNVRSLFTRTGRNVLYANPRIEGVFDPAFLFGLTAIGITAVLIWKLRRRHLWMLGLLWFLLALGPTMQLARHHILRADRYLYLPDVGVCLLAGLLVASGWAWSRRMTWRTVLTLLWIAGLIRFAGASRNRTYDWRDDATLWTASLRQDEQSADAHQNLGCTLMRLGQTEEALSHLERAIELRADHPEAHNALCVLMAGKGRLPEAVEAGYRAVRIRPDYAEAKFNLGRALMLQGRSGQALEQFQLGLALNPDDLGAHYYKAEVLRTLGRPGDAIKAYEEALARNGRYIEARYGLALALIQAEELDRAGQELATLVRMQPEFSEAHCRLAELAVRRRDYREAIARYRTALAARADLSEPRNNLAWLLATCPRPELRNGAEALSIAKPLLEAEGHDNPLTWDTVAAAYAELREFDRAIDAGRRALELAERQARKDLAADIERRLKGYAASQPYHRAP